MLSYTPSALLICIAEGKLPTIGTIITTIPIVYSKFLPGKRYFAITYAEIAVKKKVDDGKSCRIQKAETRHLQHIVGCLIIDFYLQVTEHIDKVVKLERRRERKRV